MSLSTSTPQELEGTSERYLPTFEHVLSLGQPSLRLPRYRVSHRLRYHPYPRYKPFVIPDDFLVCIICRLVIRKLLTVLFSPGRYILSPA